MTSGIPQCFWNTKHLAYNDTWTIQLRIRPLASPWARPIQACRKSTVSKGAICPTSSSLAALESVLTRFILWARETWQTIGLGAPGGDDSRRRRLYLLERTVVESKLYRGSKARDEGYRPRSGAGRRGLYPARAMDPGVRDAPAYERRRN